MVLIKQKVLRIIVVNSRDRHYNWKKIVHKKLKRWKCYVAPERYFKWENLPTDSDAYLFPVMSKKYLKEIGYYK